MTTSTTEASVPAPQQTGVTLRSALTSLPDFAIAGTFLITWLHPYALGESAVQYGLLTIMLEFIIMHSSAMMGNAVFSTKNRERQGRVIIQYGFFYTLFIVGPALSFKTWWPLFAFWALTINRLLGILIGDAPEGRERQYVRSGWALAAMLYVGATFATMLLPVPALGITRDVIASLNLPGEGAWIDAPQRALALGVLYFGLLGIAELRGWARNPKFLQGVPTE